VTAFKARAICECGTTDCPQRQSDLSQLEAGARAWVIKLGFAREDGDQLTCPICRTQLRVVVGAEDVEQPPPSE
jgi:hypothetical protein